MKIALVTGGTHGIGNAIVKLLRTDGFNVYTCARGHYKTNEDYIKCDLTNDDDIKNLFKILPKIDILVCNSGGGGRWGNSDWLKTEYNIWQQVYNKNVEYSIKLINNYLPKMIEKKWGRILIISSVLGKESSIDGRPWCQIAKSAQISLIKSLSKNKDYVRNGITFNTISPGAVMVEDTGWHKLYLDNNDEYNQYVESLPMGKLPVPTDIANAVSFICSDKANFINGANIVIDGGQSYSF